MRTHRTMALAATLSLAAGMVATDLTSGAVAAHAGAYAPPSPDQLAALRSCESGGNYRAASGNGYYGAYQFSAESWWSLGYTGYANQAPPAVQDQAVARLHAAAGWDQWPACSRSLRLSSPAVPAQVTPPVPGVPEVKPERHRQRHQRAAQRRRQHDRRSVQRRAARGPADHRG